MSQENLVLLAKKLKKSIDPKILQRLRKVWIKDKKRLKLPSVRRVFYDEPKIISYVQRSVHELFSESPRLERLSCATVLLYLLSEVHPKLCPCCSTEFFTGSYCSLSCSSKHSAQSDEAKSKRMVTNLRKYGGVTPMSSPEVVAKNRENRDEVAINEKREATNLERYKVRNVSGTKETREKTTKTWVENYGSVEARYQQAVSKSQDTCSERYGVKFAFQADEVKAKIQETFVKNYGVSSPLQNPKVWARATQTGYLKEKVCFGNGVTLTVQGSHEKAFVSELLSKGWAVGSPDFSLPYRLEEKKHFYHPDFLVTKDGKTFLIEVKSTYTLMRDLDRNLKKFRAANKYCRKNNMTFVLCMLKKTASGSNEIVSCTFPTKRSALRMCKSV